MKLETNYTIFIDFKIFASKIQTIPYPRCIFFILHDFLADMESKSKVVSKKKYISKHIHTHLYKPFPYMIAHLKHSSFYFRDLLINISKYLHAFCKFSITVWLGIEDGWVAQERKRLQWTDRRTYNHFAVFFNYILGSMVSPKLWLQFDCVHYMNFCFLTSDNAVEWVCSKCA